MTSAPAPTPVGRYIPRRARRPDSGSRLGRGIAASAAGHVVVVAALLLGPRAERPPQLPV